MLHKLYYNNSNIRTVTYNH